VSVVLDLLAVVDGRRHSEIRVAIITIAVFAALMYLALRRHK
jgi:hypothetical protein